MSAAEDSSSPAELVAAVEGLGVLNGRERLVLRVVVGALLAVAGVAHREVDLDVGHAGREDPVLTVGAAGIEQLDGQLDVLGMEEPVVAGAAGHAHRLGRALLPAGPPVPAPRV